MGVLQHIMPQLQDLYQYLEKDFSPLKLCAQVNTIFEFLQENEDLELAQYIKPLQNVAIIRLLKQVSQRERERLLFIHIRVSRSDAISTCYQLGP